jgi:4-hydroxy-tetrahydrodipicolinate synthase
MSTRPVAISGCGTALVTPFRGEVVDLEALGRLVEAQIADGVDFLVPVGTTGEAPTLSEEERLLVISKVLDTAAGRVPVVAGTGGNDTRRSVALTKAARKAGAAACLAVSPYYNRPTQEGLYRHFRSMIDEGGLPAVLYHVPSRTGVPIEVETVARTVAGGGVAGLKETGSVDRVTRIRERAVHDGTPVPILSGDDGITLPMIALGAVGVISVASNVVPALVADLVRRARAGEGAGALALHERLSPLFRALFVETNPIPVKAAMVLAGLLPADDVRLPLTTATPATREGLRTALRPFFASVHA